MGITTPATDGQTQTVDQSFSSRGLADIPPSKNTPQQADEIHLDALPQANDFANASVGLTYTCLFTTVWDMITTLQSSRADMTYKKKIEYYTKPDLLILDELGYRSMGETTVEDFFEVVSRRYEKKSTIVTSNREFTSWDKIFIDKTLTGAIIDRLIHHCHTFIIKGESYRFKNRSKEE